MSDSQIRPALQTARDYVAARERRARAAGDRIATVGLRLLLELIDGVDADMASRDLVEVALVYDALAGQLTDITGAQVTELFAALAELCDDDQARLLVQRLPPAGGALLDTLRRTVLRIRVTYESRGATSRVLQLICRGEAKKAIVRTVEHSMAWEDLPDDVRAQILATAERTVVFQLFPHQS